MSKQNPLFYNPNNEPITWIDYVELEMMLRLLEIRPTNPELQSRGEV